MTDIIAIAGILTNIRYRRSQSQIERYLYLVVSAFYKGGARPSFSKKIPAIMITTTDQGALTDVT